MSPWFGLPVFVHQAAIKSDDVVFRCTLSGSAATRWLEILARMFDHVAWQRLVFSLHGLRIRRRVNLARE